MTVKKLKEILNNIPDDTNVTMLSYRDESIHERNGLDNVITMKSVCETTSPLEVILIPE